MKVIINSTFGGFSISREARAELQRRGSAAVIYGTPDFDVRTDPQFVALLAEWGTERVSGVYARLKVVDVPDDVAWHIEEYDGAEWVAEDHRVWE